jgi:hypothetical protein
VVRTVSEQAWAPAEALARLILPGSARVVILADEPLPPGVLDPREIEAFGSPSGNDALERLERLEVLSPQIRNGSRRYGPDDVQIIEAVSRMRASGYSEALGFTVYDTLIYKRNLERLVREEVGVMMERLAGEMDTDEAAELLERAEP